MQAVWFVYRGRRHLVTVIVGWCCYSRRVDQKTPETAVDREQVTRAFPICTLYLLYGVGTGMMFCTGHLCKQPQLAEYSPQGVKVASQSRHTGDSGKSFQFVNTNRLIRSALDMLLDTCRPQSFSMSDKQPRDTPRMMTPSRPYLIDRTRL